METLNKINSRFTQRRDGRPINIAVLGCGWFGSGLIEELGHWPSIVPRVIFTRAAQNAGKALMASGVSQSHIVEAASAADLRRYLKKSDTYVIAGNPDWIGELEGIDAVFDATGHILTGAKAAVTSFEKGMHFITISAELDATVGPVLKKMADDKDVIYSVSDGDQPGVLGRLIREVISFGFFVELAGNCKGFLDVHKTPDDIKPWVGPGQNPKMIASFTDGTKQGIELATVANAYGLSPDVRGMHGIKTTKAALVKDFMQVLSKGKAVDYCMGIDGIDQGAGVFVVGKREGERIHIDMKYLKKGDGPHYLFFRDHHLNYIEAPRSIIDAVVHNEPTIAPAGHYADVLTVAKRDLKAGERLDGIGGYTIYGLIDTAQKVREENLLPIGLAEYAVVTRDIARDTPLTYNMVDIKDNLVPQLRAAQDEGVAIL